MAKSDVILSDVEESALVITSSSGKETKKKQTLNVVLKNKNKDWCYPQEWAYVLRPVSSTFVGSSGSGHFLQICAYCTGKKKAELHQKSN